MIFRKKAIVAWNARYLPVEKVIEVTFTQKLLSQELKEMLQEVIKIAQREKTFKVLGDCSQMVMNASIVSIFDFPKIYEDEKVDHRMKEAVILPENPETRKNVEFYETVCRNRGYNVKAFPDRETALVWLDK